MKRTRKILLYSLILISLFIGLWVAQDNPQEISLTLLGFQAGAAPVGFILVLTLGCGLIIGMLSSLPAILRLRAANKNLRRKVDTL